MAQGPGRSVLTQSRQQVPKLVLAPVPRPRRRGPAPEAPIRARAVAVLINEPTTMVFGDPFFAPLLKGIYQALTAHSMLLVMLIPRNVAEMEFAKAYMIAGHVGGAILVSLHSRSSLPAQLLAEGLPVVCCGRPPLDTPISYVDTDNRRGAEIATEHLISLGRTRIATISGDLDMPAARDRLAGYRDALARAGVTPDPSLEELGGFVPDRAQMAMERLLINHPDVDAVFVCSDNMAAAAVDVLHRAGKRIPEDVAVIGYDDTPVAMTTRPALSTMRQPIESMGTEAVNLLMQSMIDLQWEPQQSILEVELVVRESTVGIPEPFELHLPEFQATES
jgi:DNA-binding LacI/PurR family transcriptional regulator